MNIKKYLKKEAQANLRDSETDGDRAFLARMLDSVEEKPKKNCKKQWLWAIPAGVAACTVAAVLSVELVAYSDSPLGDVKYEEGNFVQIDSNLTELYGALDSMTVNISENQTVNVQKTYDSLSGDDLFYTVVVEEVSESAYYSMQARIIVNDKFELDNFEVGENDVTEIYPDYTVNYSQTVEFSSDMGLNLVQCNAKIESAGSCDIFITQYKEYSLGDGTFLNVIDNLFDFE